MYTTERVNFREEPNRESDVITVLNKREAVEVIGSAGEWSEILCNGENGYIASEYLVRVVIQNFLKKPVISTVFKADE